MATTRPVLACPPCETGPFTRNHYFTGKLLVERDFTDEQRYYVDKLRHHHRNLHGWGVVCGLKVKPHPNPACRDRFVCIEPGTAVDCCGREIIVAEEECIELEQFEAVRALLAETAGGDGVGGVDERHTLQITVCYRECPTEEIPVLYDECGCDDTQCAPNRILESFRFEVRIDPPEPEPQEPGGVTLTHAHTLAVARAHRVELAGATRRVYVLTASGPAGPASLLAFSADTHALLHAASFAATDEVMDLAVAADGSLVFVSLRSTAPGETRPLLVRVLDGNLALVHHLTLPDDAPGVTVPLAASADGRLYALNTGSRRVYAWPEPRTDGYADRIEVVTAPAGSRLLRVSPDGAWLFVAGPAAPSVTVVDTGTETSSTLALPAGTRPAALAVSGSAGTERLFVADLDGGLRVFGLRPGEPTPFPQHGAAVDLGGTPVDLAASAGGRWVYALLEDGGDGRVQAVDAHRVEINDPDPLAGSLETGSGPRSLALAEGGTRLYAAGVGDPAAGEEGGVAVIDVTEARCEDVLLRSLEGCPECEDECLVLATVRGWSPGDSVEEDDIDNWAGRRLLPSTSDLAAVLRCLLERGGGGGAPGEPGPPGLGIDDVEATFVECTQPGSAQIQTIAGVRTLVLEIPRGCDGEDGSSAGIDDVTVEIVPCTEPGSAEIQESGGVRTLHLEIPRGCDGEDGAPGQPGPGIDDVEASFVPCTEPGSAEIEESGGARTLVLEIPRGCDGAPGRDGVDGQPGRDGQDGVGLEKDLTRIRALSWTHRERGGGLLPIQGPDGRPLFHGQEPLRGVVIAFTDEVRYSETSRPLANLFKPEADPIPLVDFDHVFQVLTVQPPAPGTVQTLFCRCALFGDVIPVDPEVPTGSNRVTAARVRMDTAGNMLPTAPAVAWVPDPSRISGNALEEAGQELWVALRGDFVVDVHGRAVDAEFVRAQLPTGDRPAGSDHGVQGGLFESWFRLAPRTDNDRDLTTDRPQEG
ncbi:MAG TPA: hypothetical protein VHG28_21380 [Longimicrobiaceae bacterium]|nr:hypothetical protein [Longimicrobiaceae bacterium]